MSNTTVNVMDQFAKAASVSAAEVIQTPMHHVANSVNAREATTSASTVALAELELTGVLVLRANASRDALSDAL
jgi:hypothetical protein